MVQRIEKWTENLENLTKKLERFNKGMDEVLIFCCGILGVVITLRWLF